MQISIQKKDGKLQIYVIDCLALRSEIPEILGPTVIENADILKVIHDSESAIGYLQRDFGIQISNIFDVKYLSS